MLNIIFSFDLLGIELPHRFPLIAFLKPYITYHETY